MYIASLRSERMHKLSHAYIHKRAIEIKRGQEEKVKGIMTFRDPKHWFDANCIVWWHRKRTSSVSLSVIILKSEYNELTNTHTHTQTHSHTHPITAFISIPHSLPAFSSFLQGICIHLDASSFLLDTLPKREMGSVCTFPLVMLTQPAFGQLEMSQSGCFILH